MQIDELFDHLDKHRGSFPSQAIAECIAGKEEVLPRLLQVLEDVDNNPEKWRADQSRMIHIHAMYLLALFREQQAGQLLVRIFSRPGEFVFDLAGDVVTQDLGRILASVSGGDTGPMTALIENEQANEWVRALAIDAVVKLVATGQRTRDEVMAYLLQLFKKLERIPGAQWDGLANACADLWPHEALYELNRAYKDGLVDKMSISWDDIERALAMGKEGAMRASNWRPLITDLAGDMSWMRCFKKQEPVRNQGEVPSEPDWYLPQPVRRTQPKVGRNDPCVCGSGKKFKKCCGVN